MSAIFKARKIPKHLVIEDESRHYRRSRFSLMKFMLWGLLLLATTGGVLIAVDAGLQRLEQSGQ